MDIGSSWIEVLKIGGPMVLITIFLLRALLHNHEQMALELNKDKDRLLQSSEHMATVVANNTAVMESVKRAIEHCERKARGE
jgi:hypothetical protein